MIENILHVRMIIPTIHMLHIYSNVSRELYLVSNYVTIFSRIVLLFE